ncbi:hypothetical protein C8A03DRAFT_38933 [Achaetomium macrosporum]|uniref:NmrA-like domain-containing protein n=1 Tax=Achaetomium macrosporum TaxID=79813 RepID=A0AAN7C1J4_9PEZI|nr:hypothetical protein C8A03DRAFT_38933 [Achaetomium macrosporum]
MTTHKVFVCAATGVQGGAVARQLRAIGWEVHTTTRNVNSPAAQALSAIGVKVYPGTWSDSAALESAISGCDKLFLNLIPDITNPTSELEDGKNVLRIAKAAGVNHVVYSSSIALPPEHMTPFLEAAFKSKHELENLVQTSGLEHWAILKPGFFMSNFLEGKVERLYPGGAETGVFNVAFRPDTTLPMIDHEDIGAYAVAAFRDPQKFDRHRIDLVSEGLAVENAFKTMRKATGRNIRVVYLTDDEVQQALATNPMLVFQQVVRNIPTPANLDETHRGWGIKPGTFEKFVEREIKDFQHTYRNVEA